MSSLEDRNASSFWDRGSYEPNDRTRNQLAAYYTPRAVCAALAGWAIQSGSDSVLEPGFGGCEILECIGQRLESLGVQPPWESVFGCDVSTHAHRVLWSRFPTGLKRQHFVHNDFFAIKPGGPIPKVDVVIGNPPYIGHHKIPASRQALIKRVDQDYPVEVSGRSNLWAHFLAHALRFLKEDGRLAFVLPISYRHADFASSIRHHLRKSFERVTTVLCREPLFTAAHTSQRTLLLLAEGFHRGPGHCEDVDFDTFEDVLAYLDNANQKPAQLASREEFYEANAVLQRIYNSRAPRALGALATVRIGLVTGAAKFFLGTRSEWKDRGVSSAYVTPVVSSSRHTDGLILTREDLERSATDLPVLMLAPPSHHRDHALLKYLASPMGKQAKATSTSRKRVPWYVVPNGLPPHAIVPSISHRGLRMILLKEGVWATNTFYGLWFSEPEDATEVAVFMHSTFAQLCGELIAQPLSQGGLKLRVRDLSRFPTLRTNRGSVAIKAASEKVDSFLRAGRLADAREVADNLMFDDLLDSERTALESAHRRLAKRRLSLKRARSSA